MRLVYWVSHLWYSQAHAYWRWSQSTCLPLLILRTRIITLTLLSGDLRISRELSTCAAPFGMHDISVTPLWSLSQSQSPPLRSRSAHSKSLIRQVSLSHSSKINIENHFSYASFPGSYQHLILFIPRCILLLSSRTIPCPPDIALGLPLRRHSTLRYSQRMAIIGSISRYSQHSSSSPL